MRNILLIITEVLICYITMVFLSKKYKTDGLYIYGIISSFASCIMSLKTIEIAGINIPLGLGTTTSLLIASNIITQKRGPQEVINYILLIIITCALSCCFLNLSGILKSSDYNLYANNAYNSIFKYNIRVYIGLILSVIPSIFFGSKIYFFLKRIQNKIVFSNIFTIIIIEFMENIVFVLIAYLSTTKTINIVLCIICRYIIKIIIGITGTIPIYIANKY